MTKTDAIRATLCGGALLCTVSAFAAFTPFTPPTPQELITKARAAINGAKTYQATILTNVTGGNAPVSLSLRLKKSGAKAWAHVGMDASGAGGKANPAAAMLQDIQIFDDGKNTYTYITAMKQYNKSATGASKQFNLADQLLEKIGSESTLKPLAPEAVDGRQAYVVEAIPKKAAAGQNSRTRLYFDQATAHLVQIKSSQIRPSNGTTPAMQQSLVVQVKDEKVNQPIPDSTFVFTPPPGATQMRAGGMGMGFPGAGAPRQR